MGNAPESLAFEPRLIEEHDHLIHPLERLLSPVSLGARGTRENCRRLFAAGEAVLVFPGGGREVMKHEPYQLICKQRIGFAHLAIQHGVPIVPFAPLGVEEMFEIVVDADDILRPSAGDLPRALGITEQPWFCHGEVLPPIARGKGFGPFPRIERQ
jgi:1-acyl-sn-glycerol-3-phosphate acyltransferase